MKKTASPDRNRGHLISKRQLTIRGDLSLDLSLSRAFALSVLGYGCLIVVPNFHRIAFLSAILKKKEIQKETDVRTLARKMISCLHAGTYSKT